MDAFNLLAAMVWLENLERVEHSFTLDSQMTKISILVNKLNLISIDAHQRVMRGQDFELFE